MDPVGGASPEAELDDGGRTLGVRAAHGVFWLALINLTSKGGQIAVTVVLASFLTQSELGLITVAVSLVSMAQVVQAMGVYDVIARTDGDPLTMARTVALMSTAVGLVAAAVLIATSEPVADLLGVPDSAPLIVITAISLPFTAFGGVQMALMHRSLDFRQRMLPDAGSALIGAVVTVGLAVAGAGPYSLAYGLLCGAILQPIFGAFVGVRLLPGWDRTAAGEAARWIRVVGPAAIVWTVLINVDYPTISRVLGPDDVGEYSLAYRIAWIPYIMIAVVLGSVAFPYYTGLIRGGEGDQISGAVGRFTYATLLSAGGLYVLIAIMSGSVVVLGERWEPAIPVLIVLCGYGLGISLLCTFYEAIRVVGWTRTYLALEVAHLVLLLALLFTLTRYGVVAAAAAQLIAVVILVPVTLAVTVKAGVAPPARTVGRAIVGLAVPGLFCYAVHLALFGFGVMSHPVSWIEAIVEGVLLVACFAGVGFLANRAVVGEMRELRKEQRR